MKTILIMLLLLFTFPVQAEETKVRAEQIRTNSGQYCSRCDYVLQDGWVTKVIQDGQEWKLKPKEALFILPFGMRPESILNQIYRVSPDYGKTTVTTPTDASQPSKN